MRIMWGLKDLPSSERLGDLSLAYPREAGLLGHGLLLPTQGRSLIFDHH